LLILKNLRKIGIKICKPGSDVYSTITERTELFVSSPTHPSYTET